MDVGLFTFTFDLSFWLLCAIGICTVVATYQRTKARRVWTILAAILALVAALENAFQQSVYQKQSSENDRKLRELALTNQDLSNKLLGKSEANEQLSKRLFEKSEANEQLNRRLFEKSEANEQLSKRLFDKSEANEQLSMQLYKAQKATTDQITGANSFCHVMFVFTSDPAKATLVALHSGSNPVSDLVVRMLDVTEIAGSSPIEFGTPFVVGTVPVRDIRPFGATPVLGGVEKRFVFEFSARNGAWSQSAVLRKTKAGRWATLTQLFDRVPRIVSFEEMQKTQVRGICIERDANFPASEEEVFRWTGGRRLPRCAALTGFPPPEQ
jgi:hypothetical protein